MILYNSPIYLCLASRSTNNLINDAYIQSGLGIMLPSGENGRLVYYLEYTMSPFRIKIRQVCLLPILNQAC